MTIPPDPVARINFLRQKVIDGEEISDEEIAQGISLLRQQQELQHQKVLEKEAKAAPMNLKDLFKQE